MNSKEKGKEIKELPNLNVADIIYFVKLSVVKSKT